VDFCNHLVRLLQHDGVVTISNKTAYDKLQTKDLSEKRFSTYEMILHTLLLPLHQILKLFGKIHKIFI